MKRIHRSSMTSLCAVYSYHKDQKSGKCSMSRHHHGTMLVGQVTATRLKIWYQYISYTVTRSTNELWWLNKNGGEPVKKPQQATRGTVFRHGISPACVKCFFLCPRLSCEVTTSCLILNLLNASNPLQRCNERQYILPWVLIRRYTHLLWQPSLKYDALSHNPTKFTSDE